MAIHEKRRENGGKDNKRASFGKPSFDKKDKREGTSGQGRRPAGARFEKDSDPRPQRGAADVRPRREGDKGLDDNICWGRNPAVTLLKERPDLCREVLLQKGVQTEFRNQMLNLSGKAGVKVTETDRSYLDNLSSGSNHQGVLLKLKPLKPADLDDVLNEIPEGPSMLIMSDHCKDPHNLGAIIRSAEVCGAHCVIYPSNRSASVNGTVIKTSAGAAFRMPVAEVVNVTRSLNALKERGYWVVGLDGEGDRSLWDVKLPDKMVLVVGSEGDGISRLVLENCDVVARIPMVGDTGSLNASVAASIGMFEWMREFNNPSAVMEERKRTSSKDTSVFAPISGLDTIMGEALVLEESEAPMPERKDVAGACCGDSNASLLENAEKARLKVDSSPYIGLDESDRRDDSGDTSVFAPISGLDTIMGEALVLEESDPAMPERKDVIGCCGSPDRDNDSGDTSVFAPISGLDTIMGEALVLEESEASMPERKDVAGACCGDSNASLLENAEKARVKADSSPYRGLGESGGRDDSGDTSVFAPISGLDTIMGEALVLEESDPAMPERKDVPGCCENPDTRLLDDVKKARLKADDSCYEGLTEEDVFKTPGFDDDYDFDAIEEELFEQEDGEDREGQLG